MKTLLLVKIDAPDWIEGINNVHVTLETVGPNPAVTNMLDFTCLPTVLSWKTEAVRKTEVA